MKRVNRIASLCVSIAMVVGSLALVGCGSGDDPVLSEIVVNTTVYASDGATGVNQGSVVFNICVQDGANTPVCTKIPGIADQSFSLDANGGALNAALSLPQTGPLAAHMKASDSLTVTTCQASYTDSNATACAANAPASGPNAVSAKQTGCLASLSTNDDGTLTATVEAFFKIPDYNISSASCSGGTAPSTGSTSSTGTGPTAMLNHFNTLRSDSRTMIFDSKHDFLRSDDVNQSSQPSSSAASARI